MITRRSVERTVRFGVFAVVAVPIFAVVFGRAIAGNAVQAVRLRWLRAQEG